jgi:hypothetical protein
MLRRAEGSLKIFLSWSGTRSKAVAVALREWLPLVLHYAEPWLSDRDIAAGERWAVEIGKELEGTEYGVIVLTRDNLAAPWILFETGALSKAFTASAVCPYLVDVDFRDIAGPIAQFQAKKADAQSTLELITAINAKAPTPADRARVAELFSVLWPKLGAVIQDLPNVPPIAPAPARNEADVIEELVESNRRMEARLELLATVVKRLAVPPSEQRGKGAAVELYVRGSFLKVSSGVVVEFHPTGSDIIEDIATVIGAPATAFDEEWWVSDPVSDRNLSPAEIGKLCQRAITQHRRVLFEVSDVPF